MLYHTTKAPGRSGAFAQKHGGFQGTDLRVKMTAMLSVRDTVEPEDTDLDRDRHALLAQSGLTCGLDEVASLPSQGALPDEMHRFVADFYVAFEKQVPTFRRLSGNRTYIITTSRITSGDELR